MEGSSFSFFDLPNDQLTKLEKTCSDFERELRSQDAPRLINYLDNELSEPEKLYLLSVMIPMELEFQGKLVTRKAINSYKEKYPELSELTSKVIARLDLTWVNKDSQRTLRRDQTVDPNLKLWPGETVDDRYRITTLLGSGSFGVVYRAYDKNLRRDVALKVSIDNSNQAIAMKERLLVEAQSSASLKSDGIATIYDIFTKDDKVFIVQEFVQGRTLDQVLASHDFDVDRAVALVTEMGKAISHAHAAKIYHRDLKPSNIIINSNGQPTIVDFGLAMTAHAVAMTDVICGTPNYMSPEQVRGEVNRTDAKSDMWSIGVILYELLTNRKPFDAEETDEVFNRIKSSSPKPVTELKSDVPVELNRIVMRCLAKKKRDRYRDVVQLVEELERFRAGGNQLDSDSGSLSELVVPKGLRAFSFEDNEFFMQMLPGPRDFRGVPESVLFWKNQIENLGAFDVFPVGMIYGASGCGKSSFVKAGLLPSLSSNIQNIFVESTRHETEIRLLKALRRKFPELGEELSLPNAFARIRDGGFLAEGEKLLVVVDQFEQWLAFNNGQNETQLLNAMRHCDGAVIQCLFLIREEYWTKAGEFMDQLEIPLVQNENYRSIELFDLEHAQRLLEQIGRAYGKFDGELDAQQSDFIEKAIDELSQNGRVVGARLALFSEAFRSKSWTVESLGRFGGADGVGVAFLNDSFVDSSAPLRNRMHSQSVQNCLAALLPESRSNLKGHMVAKSQLLAFSGYGNQQSKFDEMLHILDKELRLISSTKPSGEDVGVMAENSELHYQLTHDYLVPILRRWIDSEKQRKVSGRVQARMAQVSSVWSEIGHNRYLPTFLETISFLTMSKWKDWTAIQSHMMRASIQKHLPAFVAVSVFVILTVLGIHSYWSSLAHERLISDFLEMPIGQVGQVANDLKDQDNRELVQKVRNRFGKLETAKVPDDQSRRHQLMKTKLAIVLAKLASTNWNDVAEGIFAVDLEKVPDIARLVAGNVDSVKQSYMNEIERNLDEGDEHTIRQALSLAEWGATEPLIEIAINAGLHDLPQYIKFLEPHMKEVSNLLHSRVRKLNFLIPKYPSQDLKKEFVDAGGVVGRFGAVVFAATKDVADQLSRSAEAEGFVPTAYRSLTIENEERKSIVWKRSLPQTNKSPIQAKVVEDSNFESFENVVKQLTEQEWTIVDISHSFDAKGQGIFSALLHENNPTQNKVELNESYESLNRSVLNYTEAGYQVSRMCAYADDSGLPRYSTIWEKLRPNVEATVPSFCLPDVGLAKDKFRLLLGANHADCQFFEIDLDERDWFGLHDAMRKDQPFIKRSVQNPSVRITTVNSDPFLEHFARLRRLNLVEDAHQLANRFLRDLPDWTDGSVSVARLYSDETDAKQFENELDRIEKFDFLGRGSTEIRIPCCKLRFQVANGNLEAAESLYDQIVQRLSQLRTELKDKAFAVDIINRGLVRVHLIMANAYQSDVKKKGRLVSAAIDLLENCAPRSYLYLLTSRDFDVARSNDRFQKFLWSNGYGSRIIRTWRTDDSVSSQLDEQIGFANVIKSASLWLENDYAPRTVSCVYNPTDKVLLSNVIWEKDDSKLTFESKKRLANAATILAEFGQPKTIASINAGVYGEDVELLLPKKFKRNRAVKSKFNPQLD